MDNKVIIQDVTLAATINSYLKKDNVHNFTFTEDELIEEFVEMNNARKYVK